MKTLLILLTLGTAFGANLGLPSTFLGYHDYTSGLFDPNVGHVRRIRDTNVIDTNDEQFSEDFRKYDKDRDGKVTVSEMREFHLSEGTGERETAEAVNHMTIFDNDQDGELRDHT